MARESTSYQIANENRMTKLEGKVDNVVIVVNSLEEKVDKLNTTVSRWIGGGAVLLFIGNALLAYILSR